MRENRANQQSDTGDGGNPQADIEETPSLPFYNTLEANDTAQTNQQAKSKDGQNLIAGLDATPRVEESSDAAWWGVGVELAGVVLSFIGIWLVVLALKQTDKSLNLAMKDRADATRRAIGQSEETAQALRHAEVSAVAMAKVAETNQALFDAQKIISELHMRAYLTVLGHPCLYQDRSNNIRFEGRGSIVNSGNVAAKNVEHRIGVGIYPYPYKRGFNLPDPPVVGEKGFIPPRQNRVLALAIEDFVRDERVEDIVLRQGEALYFWGKITYDDEFGVGRVTNFAQCIFWQPSINGGLVSDVEYIPDKNGAD